MIEAIGLTYGPVASLIGAQFDANGLIMRAVYLAISDSSLDTWQSPRSSAVPKR